MGCDGKDYRAERDAAASVGTDVHNRIDRFLRLGVPSESQMLDPDDISKSDRAWDAWRSWWDERGLWMVSTEEALVDEDLLFAGTYDGLAQDDAGRYVLMDWKTSSGIYAEALAQGAAYVRLVERHKQIKISRVEIVNCTKSGELATVGYDIVGSIEETAPWRSFRAALDLYHTDAALKEMLKSTKAMAKNDEVE